MSLLEELVNRRTEAFAAREKQEKFVRAHLKNVEDWTKEIDDLGKCISSLTPALTDEAPITQTPEHVVGTAPLSSLEDSGGENPEDKEALSEVRIRPGEFRFIPDPAAQAPELEEGGEGEALADSALTIASAPRSTEPHKIALEEFLQRPGAIQWNGGACPLVGDTLAEVFWKYGPVTVEEKSSVFSLCWLHAESANHILGYRVLPSQSIDSSSPKETGVFLSQAQEAMRQKLAEVE